MCNHIIFFLSTFFSVFLTWRLHYYFHFTYWSSYFVSFLIKCLPYFSFSIVDSFYFFLHPNCRINGCFQSHIMCSVYDAIMKLVDELVSFGMRTYTVCVCIRTINATSLETSKLIWVIILL